MNEYQKSFLTFAVFAIFAAIAASFSSDPLTIAFSAISVLGLFLGPVVFDKSIK